MAQQRQATILVVDDDPSNRELLEAVLVPAGYAVRLASGGLPALQALRMERPDAVLLDIKMAGMSGLDVLATIRQDPATTDLPVILVSASSHLDSTESRHALAADDLLRKPIVSSEVLGRVASLLTLRQRQRDLAASLAELQRLEMERYAHRRDVLGRFGVLPALPAPHAASTALVVMADPASRAYAQALLIESGYRVRPAATEAEALAAADGADLAIAALGAPVSATWLRDLLTSRPNLPIVALTTEPDSALTRVAVSLDVECILAGLPPAILLSAIRRAAHHAASRAAEVFLSERIRALEARRPGAS